MVDDPTRDDDGNNDPPPANVPVIDVSNWFNDQREIVLELEGVRYRLRLTRRNKLILQK